MLAHMPQETRFSGWFVTNNVMGLEHTLEQFAGESPIEQPKGDFWSALSIEEAEGLSREKSVEFVF